MPVFSQHCQYSQHSQHSPSNESNCWPDFRGESRRQTQTGLAAGSGRSFGLSQLPHLSDTGSVGRQVLQVPSCGAWMSLKIYVATPNLSSGELGKMVPPVDSRFVPCFFWEVSQPSVCGADGIIPPVERHPPGIMLRGSVHMKCGSALFLAGPQTEVGIPSSKTCPVVVQLAVPGCGSFLASNLHTFFATNLHK